MRTKNLAPSIVFLFLFLFVAWRMMPVAHSIHINRAAIFLNRAVNHPALRMEARTITFHAIAQEEWSIMPSLEKTHFLAAADYLARTSDYTGYEPGPQLLHNPDFVNGLIGWVQYNSHWQLFAPNTLSEDTTIVTYSRQGEGHASLSQSLELENGDCYLFSVTGSVERRDNTPTYWFYLEMYDETGKPMGQSLKRMTGSQKWAQLFTPFCLPGLPGTTTKVTVAPVNLYGDAAVNLGSTRLYQLLPTDE